MEYVTNYFWVVLCKNHHFHHLGNIHYEQKILLGEADAFSSLPRLPDLIQVRCDSCAKEYSYAKEEVLRAEAQVPELFSPHPLFL